ncbi:tripartite tricarboxylate transporter substrate binding protein [bacterium]|nr:tripartite tricarboxylate transporter substrate binding protein [bacterium]
MFALIVANIGLLMGGFVLHSKESASDGFPSRPIKLIVPFGAGGGTDTFARVIDRAIRENDLLPVPLVIVNVGGAGGSIGTRRTKDALPDGHTMMIIHEAILTARASGVVEYGPDEFDLIAATGEIGTVIGVPGDSPFNSLSDLLDEAVANPDSIRFAANMGALTHYVGLQLESMKSEAKLRFAQFGGGADRLAGLLGGHVDATGFTMEEFLKFQPKGLRALAYFGQRRHPAAPDLLTAKEQGFDMVNSNTFFWWLPKGTPVARRKFLTDVLQRAMNTDFVQTKLAESKFNPIFLNGVEAKKRIAKAAGEMESLEMSRAVDVPNVPAIAIGACLLFGAGLFWQRRSTGGTVGTASVVGGSTLGISPDALVCCGLCVVYAALLSIGVPGFRWATIGFVLLVGFVLSGRNIRRLPAIGVLAQVLGFGLFYLFTNVLVLELP